MKSNAIPEEIHRFREEHDRAFDYDIRTISAEIRRNTERLKAEAWRVVSPSPRESEAAGTLREEPPKPPNS